jgi:hypothetical protein
VRLDTLDDLAQQIDRIVAAQSSGRLRATGHWTPAQILEHLAKLIEFSYDGFPFRASWHIRAVSHLAKWIAWKPFVRFALRPGHTLTGGERALLPDPHADFQTATARLRSALGRIERGEPMCQPSPYEGWISHDQWVYGHLRHAELHLSFLQLDESHDSSRPDGH